MGWFSSKSPVSVWPQEIPTFIAVAGTTPAGSGAVGSVNRHNSPDLNAQLEQARGKPVDAVICCALDSEPKLRLNAAVAARRAESVLKGVASLVEKTGAKRACVVVDDASPAAWVDPVYAAARRNKVSVFELPNSYPQADPTMLIYALMGRRLKPSSLPTEHGVVLVDAPAAAAFGGETVVPLAVVEQLTGRVVYLEAAAGTTLGDALAAAGFGTEGATLFGGDFLRKSRVLPSQIAGAGELAIHILAPLAAPAAQPCIRCGWCALVCPTRVSPAWLLEAAQHHDERLARRGGRDACIECGLCDQVCPSRLPLLETIRLLKQT
jgi:Na+-translocating ferredoxin:NAD+ oxidoreductase subunit C